jgi:hypothetical protein
VAVGALLAPFALLGLVLDFRVLAGRPLLAGDALRRREGGGMTGKRLGLDAVEAVSPPAVVLDHLIRDFDHVILLVCGVVNAV